MKRLLVAALLLVGCAGDAGIDELEHELLDALARRDATREKVRELPALDAEVRKLEAERARIGQEWRRLRP